MEDHSTTYLLPLPLELMEHIVSLVDDQTDLYHIALTCRSLVSAARRNLYECQELDVSQARREFIQVGQSLLDNPALAEMVKILYLIYASDDELSFQIPTHTISMGANSCLRLLSRAMWRMTSLKALTFSAGELLQMPEMAANLRRATFKLQCFAFSLDDGCIQVGTEWMEFLREQDELRALIVYGVWPGDGTGPTSDWSEIGPPDLVLPRLEELIGEWDLSHLIPGRPVRWYRACGRRFARSTVEAQRSLLHRLSLSSVPLTQLSLDMDAGFDVHVLTLCAAVLPTLVTLTVEYTNLDPLLALLHSTGERSSAPPTFQSLKHLLFRNDTRNQDDDEHPSFRVTDHDFLPLVASFGRATPSLSHVVFSTLYCDRNYDKIASDIIYFRLPRQLQPEIGNTDAVPVEDGWKRRTSRREFYFETYDFRDFS